MNRCEDCEFNDECEYVDNYNFCDDCRGSIYCTIRSVSCKAGYDIECDNGFELEEEVIFNTEFDCPFCGEKIDVCDVSVANVQLITCDNCNKLIAVDGGDY